MTNFTATTHVALNNGTTWILDGWVPTHYGVTQDEEIGFARIEDLGGTGSFEGIGFLTSDIENMQVLYGSEAGVEDGEKANATDHGNGKYELNASGDKKVIDFSGRDFS